MLFAKVQGMKQRRVSSVNILSVKPAVTNTADASCKAMPPGGSTKSGTVKSASARPKDDASARDNERIEDTRSWRTVETNVLRFLHGSVKKEHATVTPCCDMLPSLLLKSLQRLSTAAAY